jgi:hypothetical protein
VLRQQYGLLCATMRDCLDDVLDCSEGRKTRWLWMPAGLQLSAMTANLVIATVWYSLRPNV